MKQEELPLRKLQDLIDQVYAEHMSSKEVHDLDTELVKAFHLENLIGTVAELCTVLNIVREYTLTTINLVDAADSIEKETLDDDVTCDA